MIRWVLWILSIWLVQCSDAGKNQKENVKTENPQRQHTTGANHYMHQIPFDTLVSRFEHPDRQIWQKPDSVVNKLALNEQMIVADIGAGTGYFSFRMAPLVKKVIALDVDSRFLKYLQQKKLDLSLENVEPRKTIYTTPGLRKQEVDLVLMVDTYHHIENRIDYLRLLKQGLKNDGRMVIIDFRKGDFPIGPPDQHKLSMPVILSELTEAGFQVLHTDTTWLPFQYWIEVE